MSRVVPRTAVVTDSTARLTGPGEDGPGEPDAPVGGPTLPLDPRELGARVVELDVLLDGEPAPEGALALADLLAAVSGGARATTSRPSPAGLAAAYAAAAADGASAVVSVHLSGALSGTVDAARLAARDAEIPVEVVDTRAVGGAHLLAVVAAARLAHTGTDVRRAADVARAVAAGSATWVSPAAAPAAPGGGRLGALTGRLDRAGRALLEVQDGEPRPVERLRTSGRVVERLAGLAVEHVESLRAVAGDGRAGLTDRLLAVPASALDVVAGAGLSLRHAAVVVQHSGAADLAGAVADRVRERAPGVLVVVAALGPVLATHVGPGAVGVSAGPLTGRPHNRR